MNKLKGNMMLIVLVLLAVFAAGGYMYYQKSTKAQQDALLKQQESEKAAEAARLEQEAAAKKELVLTLNEQNTSGETGTATLKEVDGKLTVSLDLTGAPVGITQPAHIHTGTCAEIGAVKYPLTFPLNGKSESTLDVTLSVLKSELPLALNVHKSAAEASVYVACADIVMP